MLQQYKFLEVQFNMEVKRNVFTIRTIVGILYFLQTEILMKELVRMRNKKVQVCFENDVMNES